MPRNPKKLKVFICTAREDLFVARKIRHSLLGEKEWIIPWLYTEDMDAGRPYEQTISLEMMQADVIIICFSNETAKKLGYFQKEIKTAVKRQELLPSGDIGILPVKINNCNLPYEIENLGIHFLEYFEPEKAYEKLLKSLRNKADSIGIRRTKVKPVTQIKKLGTPVITFSSGQKRDNELNYTVRELCELVLDEEFTHFSFPESLNLTRLKYTLGILLERDDRDIIIRDVTRGSVRFLIELPKEAFERLDSLVRKRDKDLHRLLNVKSFRRIEQYDVYIPTLDVLHKRGLDSSKTVQNILVGREKKKETFQSLLNAPYGDTRIALILGDGGMGKTFLVRELLEQASEKKMLAPEDPIDLFATEYRNIDGLQWKIKEIVENLAESVGKPSPFASWIKGETDTSENFYNCLRVFCAKHSLVLAFDTFENLDTVASNWLFNSDPGGLQVPGLICIIAGRTEGREEEELDGYRTNPLVQEIPISGFTLEEAQEFYKRITGGFSGPFGDDLRNVLGMEATDPIDTGIERVWKITDGHPLKMEMAFRWPGDILSSSVLAGLSVGEYEEKLMQQLRDWGQQGSLSVTSLPVMQPVFETLLCMAHITRRFNMQFLEFLIKEKFVNFGDSKASKEEVLAYLKQYFFVKRRDEGLSQPEIIQLHDEMARLVRKYIWRTLDKSDEKRFELFSAVIRFYDGLIAQDSGNLQGTLQVEQLYYTLQQDRAKSGKRSWSETGLQRWFELAELGSENIKKLLPGEIKRYIKEYDIETQVKIHSKLAEIERNANHIKQSLGHWEEVRKLGKSEQRDDWMVEAFLGKFKADSIKNPEKAYRTYLLPAKRLAETMVQEKLTTVYHDIGFANRLMQDINEAVRWYDKALEEYRKRPTSSALEAAILNDRGYAYIYLGKWGFTTRDVGDALKIRQSILDENRKRLKNAKEEEKERLLRAVAGSALRTGMSHNTLGDFGRYADQLENALQHYKEALDLFREADANSWQAKALCGLGETYRRLALEAKKFGDMELCENHLTMALENMQASLYICQKYQIDHERDTACRRIGRLYHDRALISIEQQQDKQVIQKNLQTAHDYFEEGLKYALNTKDDLEEFENLTEMAFLLDDAIEALGANNVPAEFRNALENLEKALKKYKNDKIRIYQYPVFENLMRLERAAITFAYQDYSKALTEYLEAYKGLGSTAGYGIARYRQHRDHLKTQIGKLPRGDLKVEWCKKFIETWENTAVRGSKPRRTLADDLPDLVEWCYKILKKSE